MMQAQSTAQGYIKSFYSVDAGIKMSFLKNNAAAVTFRVNDIFRTRINEQYSANEYFTQTYSRINNPQLFRLTFSYRFGKLDQSLFKRKNMQSETGSDMMN
ncbi:outer membrane beta-barrel protein [Flavisolibacter tropicus]|uniref:Outer membrane protein beta-barrel domain-containing protein n=1 Tax=Flavisolibacter tropicus TaxID=1492898 RepID=A0A172TUV2_9BACT|nr:outer membrane beta-barrel protein [Flavisolibacter tropicus]ANE50766.1 hypothetical protein SY85_09900 [Flavisolibacter tropicus]